MTTETKTDKQAYSDQNRRRVLDKLGASDSLAGLRTDMTAADLRVFVPALIIGVLAMAMIGNGLQPFVGSQIASAVGAFALVVCFLAAGLLVFITRDHYLTPLGWLKAKIAFWREDNVNSIDAEAVESRTDTLTQVARFHPADETLERTDGELIGGMEIEPSNMSLATEGEWDHAANELGAAFNALDFPFMMISTGRKVDTRRVTEPYEKRLEDPDVQSRPALEKMCELYTNLHRDNFNWRGTADQFYRMYIPVSAREVQIDHSETVSRLTELPVAGPIIEEVAGERSGLHGPDLREAQRRELENRLDTAERALDGVGKTKAHRMATEKIANTLEEYWTGERVEYGRESDAESRFRSNAVVGVAWNEIEDNQEEN